MSDNDEFYNEEPEYQKGSVIEEKKKKKGNLFLGLLIGIVATLVLEVLVGMMFNTQDNLVSRYFAYMMGIIILMVGSMIVKSALNMFFIGTPIIVGTSFILPYFFADYFSGLMAPFLSLLPILNHIGFP